MRRWTLGVLGIAVTFFVAPAADAQVPYLPTGTKIRVTAPTLFAGEVTGVVERATVDTIRFTSAGLGTVPAPLSSVTRLQVSRGMERSPAMSAAPLWMAPGGAVLGLLASSPLAALMEAVDDDGEEAMAWGAGVGAVVGLVAGLVVRSASASERWEWVQLPHDTSASAAALPPVPALQSNQGRVRIRLADDGSPSIEGNLVEYRGDTVVVSSNARHTAVALSRVTDFRVYRGKSRASGARAGGMWGALAGAALGVVSAAGPNSENDFRNPDCDVATNPCARESDLEVVASTTAGGAMLGAGIGAIIGRDRWERVAVPRRGASQSGLSILPWSRGVTVMVRASF